MKPNCLIIDEIDGAPQSSIQVLIDHVQENVRSSKKDAKQKMSVLRPIICICNDLYAPALRQLRQSSIVFQCYQVSTHRLAERLYKVNNKFAVNF
jgi:chromosome transmission fidelity protein 18